MQATAITRIAERLAQARELFRYRRNGEGFGEWVEMRLRFSKSTAYNLLAVHQKFGGESVQMLERLPRSVLYLLSRSSTPERVRRKVLEQAGRGRPPSHAAVKAHIELAKIAADEMAKPTPAQEKLVSAAYEFQGVSTSDDALIEEIIGIFRRLGKQAQTRCILRLRVIVAP